MWYTDLLFGIPVLLCLVLWLGFLCKCFFQTFFSFLVPTPPVLILVFLSFVRSPHSSPVTVPSYLNSSRRCFTTFTEGLDRILQSAVHLQTLVICFAVHHAHRATARPLDVPPCAVAASWALLLPSHSLLGCCACVDLPLSPLL